MTDSGQNSIPVGYVRRAHGIRGDVVIRGLVQDAAERLVEAAEFDTNEGPSRTLTVAWAKPSGDDFKVHFSGIDDRNAAEGLKGTQIMMDSSDRRILKRGEWWPQDLVGCQVVDVGGVTVGKVVDMIVAGVQDRVVVARPDGARAEIPFVLALVPDVDLDARTLTVDLPTGLFE